MTMLLLMVLLTLDALSFDEAFWLHLVAGCAFADLAGIDAVVSTR